MAGTNKIKNIQFSDPAIILKNPQLPENIGMVARTMVNFGLRNLRIVKPKVSWPNKKAFAASAGAFKLIEKYTKVYDTLQDSIKDIQFLCATTVRKRELNSKYVTPRTAIRQMRKSYLDNRIGFLFGAEKAGLTNNDISEANLLITIPSNNAFGSLNLGMAVNIIAYEWNNQFIKNKKIFSNKEVANKSNVNYFKNRLLKELYNTNFFNSIEEEAKLVVNVKNIVSKAKLTDKELKILHGIVTNLKNYKINN